jgi:hypothetical protein
LSGIGNAFNLVPISLQIALILHKKFINWVKLLADGSISLSTLTAFSNLDLELV